MSDSVLFVSPELPKKEEINFMNPWKLPGPLKEGGNVERRGERSWIVRP